MSDPLDKMDVPEAADEDYTRDVEEGEETLDDQYNEDTVGFWESKQRDLLTSVLDYNLNSLTDLVRTRRIDLSPKYQRRNRWREDRKSTLIESFLMNVPVPPVFFNEDEYGSYSVIDGKQRLTSIFEFFSGRFKLQNLEVFSELNGSYFDELPQTLQTILQTRANLRAIIILRQSDPDVKYQVFRRLNTGGIRLNPQEIRNSAWPGLLNSMILDESESKTFHSVLGIRDKSRSALHREMRDAEFVLRFLTFQDDWSTFKGGMGRRLDEYMTRNHSLDEKQVEKLRKDFREAIAKVQAAFGTYAFKRWQPEKNVWREQVLASMFDAEIFAAQDFPAASLASKQPEIIEGMKALFTASDFRKAVDSATNTPSYFRDRINKTRDMISKIVEK
jgi:hypothetical protein